MLLVLFRIGEHPYALDVSQVETITPALPLRELPGAANSIVGVFEHQGRMIPVVDLSLAITGQPSERLLSSRFIIVETGVRPIALFAEQVIETLEISEESLQDTGVHTAEAPFLGEIFRDGHNTIVQCVSPHSILPEDVLASLNLEPAETP